MAYNLCDGIEFLRSLPDQSVDGIFTDPPWGSGPNIKGQKIWKKLIRQMAGECLRILKPGARVLIWVGSRMVGETIWACRKSLEYKTFLICHYIPPRFIGCFYNDHDAILYFSRQGEKMFFRKGKPILQYYVNPSTGRPDTKHPCPRPIKVVRKLINQFFEPGEYVIDPFAGSDTTGVACRELGLKYDTCELDPEMYQSGIDRNRQSFLFEASQQLCPQA